MINLGYSELESFLPNVDNIFDERDFSFYWSKPKDDIRDKAIRQLIADKVLQPKDFFIYMDY